MRLNLLRIVRSICDASEEQGALINLYGLYDTIQRLAETDTAVLVRNMAGELIKSCDVHDKLGKSGGKRRQGRRASASITPPSAMASLSMPPTPTSTRSSQSTKYFADRESRQRGAMNGPVLLRANGKDELALNGTPTLANGTGASKSRLPRTTSGRNSRQSMLTSPKKEENMVPVPSAQVPPSMSIPNSRRRRQVSGDARWS